MCIRMGLTTYLDRLVPGPDSGLDRLSSTAQGTLAQVASSSAAGPAVRLLRGNEWLGRPLHPYVVVVPVGAWLATGYYDRKAARGDAAAAGKAQRALQVGIVGALLAAVTGQVQYLDTRGAARREAALHAALNNVALGFQLGSLRARTRGRAVVRRTLSTVALGTVPVSGLLGADVATRLGVGVRIGALRRAAAAEPVSRLGALAARLRRR